MIKCVAVGIHILIGEVIQENEEVLVMRKPAAMLPNSLMMLAPGAEEDAVTIYKRQIVFEFVPGKAYVDAYQELCTRYAAQSAGIVLASDAKVVTLTKNKSKN